VSFAGRRIVFGARNTSDFDWGIFIGSIDLAGERITQVEPLIQNDGVREEDPRFSWDGAHIVYKCDGDICIYPDDYGNPVVSSACELWAPAFDASKTLITYAKRCDGSLSDRIWQYSLVDRTERQVPNAGGGPDRFSHFLGDGRIVYSHIDSGSATASLWIYEPASGVTGLLHDRTDSDDDPYPDKHDGNHLAFIGWKGNGYDLYMYRESTRDSVQLTRGVSVLGPVLFR
jgi:Tol biopolymer transport system component